jgi:hypothetical protein
MEVSDTRQPHSRFRRFRDLETLLLEVRLKQLQDFVRAGQLDDSQRENIIELLMKKLAQMKASGRYLPCCAREPTGHPQAPRPHAISRRSVLWA